LGLLAVAALLGAPGDTRAEFAPPVSTAQINDQPELFTMEIGKNSNSVSIMTRSRKDIGTIAGKNLAGLLTENELTLDNFCASAADEVYIYTFISGVFMVNAPTATPFEQLAKYCRIPGPKTWSLVAEQEVLRDLTNIAPATRSVPERRTLLLMGLSNQRMESRRSRQNRYPDMVIATTEVSASSEESLMPLIDGPAFFAMPATKADTETQTTTRSDAAAIDIGGLILLAKTIQLPLGGDGPLRYYSIFRGLVYPLIVTARTLPPTLDQPFEPFQLVARAEHGRGEIIVSVKGDRYRTVGKVDAPMIEDLLAAYMSLRAILPGTQ